MSLWTSNPAQYECARWCENDREHYKIISVEIVSEREKRFSSVIQNLITFSGSTVLKTNFAYAYKPRQYVFYRKEWWEIINVGDISLELNPQSLSLVNPEYNMQKVLELKRVNV